MKKKDFIAKVKEIGFHEGGIRNVLHKGTSSIDLRSPQTWRFVRTIDGVTPRVGSSYTSTEISIVPKEHSLDYIISWPKCNAMDYRQTIEFSFEIDDDGNTIFG